jgi:L-2,4-diaminobutyrate decarboxylase
MHTFDEQAEAIAQANIRYALERIRMDPPPLDGPLDAATLRERAGQTITAEGIGGERALKVFEEVLAPACISGDHPRYLSFIPAAPTEASILFDLVVGSSSFCANSWMEAAGAIFAENEALRWLSDLAGFPESSGGVFVSGGTAGNLSALVAARSAFRHRTGHQGRGAILTSSGAHASIAQAGYVMDVDVMPVPGGPRLTGEDLTSFVAQLDSEDLARIFAVVGTSGTTNLGIIDDLEGIADVCSAHDWWMHVDGAYGGAGLAAPSARPSFNGIERADSFIVDPHKWLFAPFDCCALLYRNPEHARAAHRQHGEYLEVLYDGEWNPSDYAHHLSRRARGLPFWFSLATHGTKAYSNAVETTISTTHAAARLIEDHPNCRLLAGPNLSIVVFERTGWTGADYDAWSEKLLVSGEGFVVATRFEGKPALRFCIVNPNTTEADIAQILDTL